jgi:hypothetical protein
MANLDVRKIRGSDAMTFALKPASGQSRRFADVRRRSAKPLIPSVKADILKGSSGPTADSCTAAKTRGYSITSSAGERSVGGTPILSCFAVLALITSSFIIRKPAGSRFALPARELVLFRRIAALRRLDRAGEPGSRTQAANRPGRWTRPRLSRCSPQFRSSPDGKADFFPGANNRCGRSAAR